MKQQVKRAAIYARSASVQERIPSYALEAQVQECLEYLRTKGYQLVSGLVYTEDANSADADRPGLSALCEAAKRGEFEVLMVYDQDRLSRSPRQVATLLAAFEQDGVKVECAGEPYHEAIKQDGEPDGQKRSGMAHATHQA